MARQPPIAASPSAAGPPEVATACVRRLCSCRGGLSFTSAVSIPSSRRDHDPSFHRLPPEFFAHEPAMRTLALGRPRAPRPRKAPEQALPHAGPPYRTWLGASQVPPPPPQNSASRKQPRAENSIARTTVTAGVQPNRVWASASEAQTLTSLNIVTDCRLTTFIRLRKKYNEKYAGNINTVRHLT